MNDIEKIEAKLEKKQAERDKILSKLEKAEKDKVQTEHQINTLINKNKDERRKSRTHRLIERGALLESYIPNAADMDNEQIKSILSAVFTGGADNAPNE